MKPIDIWLWPVMLIAIVVVFTVAKVEAVPSSSVALDMLVLILAALTLRYVVPEPAKILIERQFELSISDLIFFVYPFPGGTDPRIPRDFLLQLHVAAINTGGRKAVLSRLELRGFLDKERRTVVLPGVPMPQLAAQSVLRGAWTAGTYESRVERKFPPFVLDPDDVLTLQFRTRRGIDWSSTWNLEKIQELEHALVRPIVGARIAAIYRRGKKVVTAEFEIPVKTEQQATFQSLLRVLTKDFTTLPAIREEPIHLE